jgi:predicted TPR repeat methyltransferase
MGVDDEMAGVKGLFREGRFGEAEGVLRGVLAREAGHAEAVHFLGICLREGGNAAEGNGLMEKSLALAPGRADFHYDWGNALDADGRVEEAAAAYRRALELRPQYPQAMMNLGVALQALKQDAEAAEVLRGLVAIAPRSPSAHFNLGRVQHAMKQDEEAVVNLRRAAELDKKPRTLALLSQALHRLGRAEERDAVRDEAMAIAPEDAELLLEIGQMFSDDERRSTRCFERVLALDPANEEANFFKQAASGGQGPAALPRKYVAGLFDRYADTFDEHLVEKLQYRAPQEVHAAVLRHVGPAGAGPVPPVDILDVGCGTGLAGVLFKPLAKRLAGVDLSDKMVKQAEKRRIYDDLAVGDLVEYLRAATGRFDVALAVDVLVYIGDLEEVFAATATTVRPGGLFAFSVETSDDVETFALLSSHRYAHGEGYLRTLAEKHGFRVLEATQVVLRSEGGQPVWGHVVVLKRE